MEKLVIIDYTNSTVDFFEVDPDANIDDSYVEELGFNTNNCYYMLGDSMEITFHKEVLK